MKDDTISRTAAIKAADSIIERDTSGNNDVVKAMTAWKKFIEALPPAQPSVSKTEIVGDAISRQALLDAVEGVDWYHQNKNGEMVHGANSDEHQAWYKADDIYHVLDSLPSAQLAQDLPNGCTDTISRAAVGDALNRIEISRNASWYEFYQKALTAVGTLPSAQPGCEDAVSRADVDILIEEAQTAWLRGDILLMYPALKKGLQKVPPVTPKQPGWIPVTERLPKKDGDYLVTTHSGQIARYIFIGGFSEEYWRRCATAWMPLPTPYREGRQDDH